MSHLPPNMSTVRRLRGAATLPLAGGIIGLFLLSPLLSMRLNPYDYDRDSLVQVNLAERNSNAIAIILGEVRANLSDFLFIKTERYLHSGVAYTPHLNMEEMAASGDVQDGAPRADTLIPPAEQDFRGPIGAIHRATKPWMDPNEEHRHASGEELLPWYRVMTVSNPRNVRAYLIGAWWLKGQEMENAKEEAAKFLEEGMRNNPKAFQLYLMRGYLYREQDDLPAALGMFKQASEFMMDARPADPENDPSWTHYHEEDARAAVRLAVILERRFGTAEEALRMATRYNDFIGGDGRLDVQIAEIKAELIGTQ